MRKRIDSFEEHRRKRPRRRRRDFRFQQLHRTGQEAVRDWQTDAYRGQSGRREADVQQ